MGKIHIKFTINAEMTVPDNMDEREIKKIASAYIGGHLIDNGNFMECQFNHFEIENKSVFHNTTTNEKK